MEIDTELQYNEILKTLEEHGNEMNYKDLNDIVSHKFEGVRLVLKVMKEKGLIDFEGVVPGFSTIIRKK